MSDFKAEYAKSGRAACKGCKGNIGQDSLRLAVMVQSPMFDGKIPNWFHYACFWKRAKCFSHTQIGGFDALRWDDQQKIKDKIIGSGVVEGGDGAAAVSYKDYTVEYAKSNKSKCRGCDENIGKDEVRISKKDYDSQRAKMYGPVDFWHHVDCFVENRDDLEFGSELNVEKMVGWVNVRKEDKEELIKKLGKGEKGKKRKAPAADGAAGGKKAKKSKEDLEEENKLKEQSQLLWKYRDDLQKHVSNNAMKILLELNGQEIPAGESKLLDTTADCMAFGALNKCPECKKGQLIYTSGGYKCTGSVTEWTKCQYITQTPTRKAFKVPKEYHDVDVLKKYKYVKRERVFPRGAGMHKDDGPVSSSLDSTDSGKSKPLEGMQFVIGKTEKSKGEITKEIQRLGGHVGTKVTSGTAAVISCKAEATKKTNNIKDAEKASVQVVDEGFLESVQKGGAFLMIQSHNLVSWGSDPTTRIVPASAAKSMGKSAQSKRREKEEEKYFTKSMPSTVKMKVKGGAAVDPDSGMEDTAHIVERKGEIFNCVLGLVDVVKGTNSYYKIQALESDKGGAWWLFRAWGRVGTTIGGNKSERCGSQDSVIGQFKQLYGEKTGNDWSNRKDFKKIQNKFYPLEIDYGDDEDDIKKIDISSSTSKLAKTVQDIVRLIFDVESMKKAMLEFEIDLKKMPLGKLSKRQIESAYSILTELTNLMEKGGTQTKFLDATNRFYTLVPHDFGMKKPPLLDTAEVIKSKTEMLDNLLEIEIAYNMLKGGDKGEDPIDSHYKKLKTEMVPMDKATAEYKRLVEFVKNTHAATHNQYDLIVEEIFHIAREGEAATFSPFKDLHNHKLLWHGSRHTNFAGILSQGLRIAPPEAPVTGYMFGKGIYFADMVSKSANYCRTSKADPTGLMLLCDVALGNMYELLGSEYVTKLAKGKHSTKGIGRTGPDPAMSYKMEDDIEIPMGVGYNQPDGTKSSLLYNEFIVYDIAQVNMKYLFKMNFKYKW